MLLSDVNQIVAVGSVDGVCTAAAVLRIIGRSAEEIGLAFCQAFTVDKVDVSAWEPGRKVALVDLAVNNRDPKMTADFVRRIDEAGHKIVAVVDEHSQEDWGCTLAEVNSLGCRHTSPDDIEASYDAHDSYSPLCDRCVSFAADGALYLLEVKPQSQKDPDGPGSSGELLRRALLTADEEIDSHTAELLLAADAGDHMDFTTHFGGLVNQAVKSAIADDSRRVYLVRHFAFNREPDEKILGWVSEYESILANHDKVLAGKVDLGSGIHRVVATGLSVDMTTLMGQLYKGGARVVVLEGEAYNKALGRKTLQISFGTNDRLDLLSIIKAVVLSASGFSQKVNVEPSDEDAAIGAIRVAL